MKACKSLTLKGVGCQNRSLPFSRYCWRHQDLSWVLGTIISVIGITVTLIIGIYQERSPLLGIGFKISDDGDPCKITCVITNVGRAEAQNVYLSFNNMLPLDTKVVASPELGITLIESDRPPDPQKNPETAKLEKAFAVHIPRIAPNDTIEFYVVTTNSDNQKTGKHIVRILAAMAKVFQDCQEQLNAMQVTEVNKLNINVDMNARKKDENFFAPALLSYERGRHIVDIFTDEERQAVATDADIFSKYKESLKSVFNNTPRFRLPVIRIKTLEGEGTYGRCPHGAPCYLSYIMREQMKEGESYNAPITVPESYDDTSPIEIPMKKSKANHKSEPRIAPPNTTRQLSKGVH